MAKRSGSDTRKRNTILTARFNEQEAAAIRALAERTGLSVGALMRYAILKMPPPRARHRPTADTKAIARLLGQLAALKGEAGKHGSNLNQIAHHLNAGRPIPRLENLLENALDAVTMFYERDMAELRIACLQALGRELDRDPDNPADD